MNLNLDHPVNNGSLHSIKNTEMAGRPKHFDQTEALEKAMRLFWSKGFDCTGISDLERALGMGRQSIYNTFGDKKSLYLRSFQHYGETYSKAMLGLLTEAGSAEQKLDRFLSALISVQCEDGRSGCLLANSVSSSMQTDPEAAAMVNAFLKRLHQTISDVLIEVDKDAANRRKTAWVLVNTAQGLCVLSKAGQSKAILTGIKNQTITLIFS